MVAVNSNGFDIDTVTVSPPAGSTICPPGAAHSNVSVDFGLGAFTARQLVVASNALRAMVLPAGINKVLVSDLSNTPTPVNIALPAGATEPLSGGMLPDGNTAWVGVAGSNTVDLIEFASNSVTLQLATPFKKSDSTPAPPNLVAVRPK